MDKNKIFPWFVCTALLLSIYFLGFANPLQPQSLTLRQKETKQKSSYITNLAEKTIKLLVSKQFSRVAADFTPDEKKILTVKRLNEAWALMTSGSGPFIKITHIVTAKEIITKKFEYSITTVTCQFKNSYLQIQIAFNHENKISGLHFIPVFSSGYRSLSYVNLHLFREKKVILGKGKYKVHGTLSLPNGKGRFPAVILISGSGPMDQDETIGINKPFLNIAYGLASRGIAVLRYDKPTEEHPGDFSPVPADMTVKQEYMIDAEAAISYLKSIKQIAQNKIFLLGHSEGGMVIPRIAKHNPQIAGLIFMAAPIHILQDTAQQESYMISQTHYKTKIAKEMALLQVRTLKTEIKELDSGNANIMPPEILGVPVGYWLDLRQHNPAKITVTLKQPVLVLQGGKDYQVTSADFNLWEKELRSKKNAEFKFYPNLDHLFMKISGKIGPSNYNRPGHVAKAVIQELADWIKTHS